MSQPSSSTTATTATTTTATTTSPTAEAFLCTAPIPAVLATLLSSGDLIYRLSGQSRSLYDAYGKETTHGLRFADGQTLSLTYLSDRLFLDYKKRREEAPPTTASSHTTPLKNWFAHHHPLGKKSFMSSLHCLSLFASLYDTYFHVV
jgi:hypothetical protein